MCVFFRVLTPPFGDDPGTLSRWLEGKFTSSHLKPPGEWIETWKTRSTRRDDYPLAFADGCRYTANARETFFRLADVQYARLTPEERFLIGEYEGVSAFDNAEAALGYGGDGPLGDLKRYVVFTGVKLAWLKEEAYEGGCRVKVTKEIAPPMGRGAFICWLSGPTTHLQNG